MALTSYRILCSILTKIPCSHHPLRRSFQIPSTPSWPHKGSSSSLIVSASKKFSSPKTGKFDSKNKRGSVSTKDDDEEGIVRMAEIEPGSLNGAAATMAIDDGFVMPELPGEKPDFWEGTQWDAFGFFIQYLWAFGIIFALVACGIAVSQYNEGATDFKDTPVYKESIQSRELLEEPEGSNSEVFESNPTEQAPSVE